MENIKRPPIDIPNWNELLRYVSLLNNNLLGLSVIFFQTQFLCRGTDKKYKICMIDEEQEEIRIENQEEFDTNVKVKFNYFFIFKSNVNIIFQYAQDQGLKSLSLIVYVDDIRKFDGIYHLEKPKRDLPFIFPGDKLQNLRDNVLVDKWYIPVKLDEALGLCLTSAIKLAQEGNVKNNLFFWLYRDVVVFPGKFDTNMECKEFIEKIVPEAFRKVNTNLLVIKDRF